MTPSPRHLRRQLRARGRQQATTLKRRLKAELARELRRPEMARVLFQRRQRRRRKVAAVLWAILIVLLLLQLDCSGQPGPAGPVVVEPAPPPAPKTEPKPTKKRRPLSGKVDKSDRASMAVQAPPSPPWLSQFRLQVAARSPRLAACFNGVERPGALRWSALVHAASGRVSESVVEPVFRGVSLTPAQEACLIRGLTEQPYRLDEPNPEAAARRISLIFEF